jgi:hypothetical protein
MNNTYSIRRLLGFALFLFLQLSLSAQDYLTGKLSDEKSAEQQIFYDRTQNVVAKTSYQTLYKIFDTKKTLIATVSAIHERAKPSITITIKSQGLSTSNTIKYNRAKSGLILSNLGNLDTFFNPASAYIYLLSFADTLRDYPILHKVKMPEGGQLTLDPITKLRLRKHNELSRTIVMSDPDLKKQANDKEQEKELFNTHLLQMRDTLYQQNSLLAEYIMKARKKIAEDISVLFKSKKVYPDARRYEGQKKNGVADGTGLFMANGNYYDGLFAYGKFVSGIVTIQYEAYDYCGDYQFDSLNGTGLLKYRNESYLLGTFKEGTLQDGIAFFIGKAGEVYFGTVRNGQRAGYGELYNTKGEMYYGEFLNGVLVKGYSKDADPFGFFTYSKIENGLKTPVETPLGEAFFNTLVKVKVDSNRL